MNHCATVLWAKIFPCPLTDVERRVRKTWYELIKRGRRCAWSGVGDDEDEAGSACEMDRYEAERWRRNDMVVVG